MERERVGVFGGTFDPIHIGHLIAAEEARVACGLSRVVFLPAASPPHKQGRPITPAAHRLTMTELAIASHPKFSCSAIEMEREGPSYTVDTLAQLRALWGDAVDIVFIVGLDSLVDLPKWREPQRIIQLARLAVVDREPFEVDMAALEAKVPGLSGRVAFVPIPLMAIAASDLRERVRTGRSIKYQAPEAVEGYIYAQGLYTAP
ncbi:MAG: nicotinate-nucleotide adenylyltransferase [Anaerolineae bacterium]